jgi:hypothetical protein
MGRTKHGSLEQVATKGMEYQTFTIKGMLFRLINHSRHGRRKEIV